MFERFTDRARMSVVWAQEEARSLNHPHIGTEHLLLGLLREGDGVAARALDAAGLTLDKARAVVERRIGKGAEPPHGHMPFSPRAKSVLEFALREALKLDHDYIGTEHILLGLIREGEGVAAQILMSDVDGGIERVRENTVEILAGTLPSTFAGRLNIIRQALGAAPTVSVTVPSSSDDVIKRLEAIEARLSSIERLLHEQRGDEQAS